MVVQTLVTILDNKLQYFPENPFYINTKYYKIIIYLVIKITCTFYYKKLIPLPPANYF